MSSFTEYLNKQLDEKKIVGSPAVQALSKAKYLGAELDNEDIVLDFSGTLQIVLMKNGRWEITR